MPIVIPTADEMTRMSAYARQRTARRLARHQAQIDLVHSPYAWDATTGDVAEWGRIVREEAATRLALIGPDPDAARHRAELLASLIHRGGTE